MYEYNSKQGQRKRNYAKAMKQINTEHQVTLTTRLQTYASSENASQCSQVNWMNRAVGQ